MDLNTLWFVLIAVLFIGYVVLDGFDLGVGILHLFQKTEEDRRQSLSSIAPFWDGNEVWLITGGGALFAAFPPVYAALTSGVYLAVVFFLLALILRATALEFRSKVANPAWRHFWDIIFGLGSCLAAILLGTALGNIVKGFPIDQTGYFDAPLFSLLSSGPLLAAAAVTVLLTIQGAGFLLLKTEGGAAGLAGSSLRCTVPALAVLLAALAVFVIGDGWQIVQIAATRPATWIFAGLGLIGILGLYRAAQKRTNSVLFWSSTVIVGLLGFCAAALYPNLLVSTLHPAFSMSISNSASSAYTLKAMAVIAGFGVPLVPIYTVYIYRTFRGRIEMTDEGY